MKGKTVSPQCFPANLITNQSGCNTCTIMAPGDNSTADVNTHGGSRNGRGSSWLPKFCSVESILEEGRVSRRSSSEVFIKNPGRKSTPVHHPGDPGGGGARRTNCWAASLGPKLYGTARHGAKNGGTPPPSGVTHPARRQPCHQTLILNKKNSGPAAAARWGSCLQG